MSEKVHTANVWILFFFKSSTSHYFSQNLLLFDVFDITYYRFNVGSAFKLLLTLTVKNTPKYADNTSWTTSGVKPFTFYSWWNSDFVRHWLDWTCFVFMTLFVNVSSDILEYSVPFVNIRQYISGEKYIKSYLEAYFPSIMQNKDYHLNKFWQWCFLSPRSCFLFAHILLLSPFYWLCIVHC